MKCPTCNTKASCKETRQIDDGASRRYHCACGVKFKTLETLDLVYTDEGVNANRSANMKAWWASQRKSA